MWPSQVLGSPRDAGTARAGGAAPPEARRMAGYGAIASVSDSLVWMLRTRIGEREGVLDIDDTEIALGSPDELADGADVRLGLYLYGISEYGHSKNSGRQRLDDDTLAQPPLELELAYLLTAYPARSGDETSKSHEQQAILGLAMQVLQANSTLRGEDLRGTLTDDEPIHLALEPQPISEIMQIWKTFRKVPFYPSVTYHVSPVLIDSTAVETVPPVTDASMEYGLGAGPDDDP